MLSGPTQPNILFMHSHNTGQYVQPYGHAIPTPNLQRLAEEGTLFRRAFAAAPTCSPSRAAFLSGMAPHSCGMLGLAHRGFSMTDYRQHVVHTLKANGYFTALAGVEHTAPDVQTVGYDAILSGHDTNYPQEPNFRSATEATVDFLRSGRSQPFFLSFGLNETHRPFPKADPANFPAEDARYCCPVSPFPDTPETRAEMADLKAAARVMDTSYGAVLDALEQAGLSQNTLVFCFSDHGLQFPRHMCNLTDRGIGVYLIIRGPGGFQGGQVLDQLVSLIDLVPTLYDMAGIATPDFVQGTSLRSLVNGETATHHTHIFAEVNYHAAYEPMRCIRSERYKYIRRYDQRQRPVLPNIDDTPSKDFLLHHGWVDQPRAQEMLFDLIFDPHEAHNLIDLSHQPDQPELAAVRADLSTRLQTWMAQTDDPFLQADSLPAPQGSRVNDPDGSSPRQPPITVGTEG